MSALDDVIKFLTDLPPVTVEDVVLLQDEASAELEALRAENAKLRGIVSGCNLLNITSNEGSWKLDGELQKMIDAVMKEVK